MIIKQGDQGDSYYIIKSGRADVLKIMLEDEPEHAATLVPGDAFGEEALITNSVRNATVKVIKEMVVWELSRKDFETTTKSSFMEEVAPEEVLSAKRGEAIIDVRLDMEYDEEHIPGAIHIPLDELRKRYSELDINREYFVYCRSGRRSASATFLMRNQGFKAKNMLGGIMAWKGPVNTV